MKWKHPFFAMSQSRFAFGLPPENNANYAFIQTALDKNDKAVQVNLFIHFLPYLINQLQ
ncbi:hypothetical protein [Lactobacillus crispatus]